MIRAEVSRSALDLRAQRLGDGIADLRRDAWGHGVATVLRTLAHAGARTVVVDPEDVPAALAAGVAVTDAGPTADTRILFGLPDAPAMRAVTRVLSLKDLRRGEGVSYGYTHRAEADTRIALVAGGYAQGVVRALGNRVRVEIAGALHPIVGRVAMDVCVVDVGASDVHPDDEVVLFGGDGPARSALVQWEAATGLGAAELAAVVGLRAEREEVA